MSQNNYAKVLSLCSGAFLFYHANRVLISPLLPLIKADFGLSYAEVAALVVGYDIDHSATIGASLALARRV